MLEIVPINTEGRHVVISTISIETSINSMVNTCVSHETAMIGKFISTETCRRELMSEKFRAHCPAELVES
jgi:hypothetical protein